MPLQRRAVLAATWLLLLEATALFIERVFAAPDTPGQGLLSIEAQQEIRQVEARINQIESESVNRLHAGPDDSAEEVTFLGKLILFDENLSVNKNEACAFCHMPETGFTGPVSDLNMTTVSYPGSVRTRFSNWKPQTHTYATYTPVLHYNAN